MASRSKEVQQSPDAREINRQVIQGLLDQDKGYPLAFKEFNNTESGKYLFLEADETGTISYLIGTSSGVLLLKNAKHLSHNETNCNAILEESRKRGWNGTTGDVNSHVSGKHFSIGNRTNIEVHPVPYYDHENLESFRQAMKAAHQEAVEKLSEIEKELEKRKQDLDPENILLFLQKTNHGEA